MGTTFDRLDTGLVNHNIMFQIVRYEDKTMSTFGNVPPASNLRGELPENGGSIVVDTIRKNAIVYHVLRHYCWIHVSTKTPSIRARGALESQSVYTTQGPRAPSHLPAP